MLLLSASAVYLNSLANGFVYDDAWQVIGNRWVTDIKYIPEIFSNNVWGFRKDVSITNYYRPVMHLIYMTAYHLFGRTPWGFHLVNILFHDGVCVLVFFIASRLLKESRPQHSAKGPSLTPPLMAALLFATHPIHTEAVAWVAGLPDLSFTFFYFLSFYFYIRSANSNSLFKGAYLLSVTSFFLATLCKEPSLTLPFILAGYDCTFRRREISFVPAVKKYIPFLIVAGIYFILRFHALRGFAPLKVHTELGVYQNFINVFPLFVQYLEKLILPINLNIFYVLHPISSISGAKGISSLIIATAFIVLIFIALRTNRVAFIALLFIALPLLPVLYIPVAGETTFAERYLYISSFGFVLLAASLLDWAAVNNPAKAAALTILSIVVTGLYSIGTVSRNTTWKDDCTLFADAARKSPDADLPHYNLGLSLQKKGKMEEAIEQYQTALKLNPDHVDAHINLGLAIFSKGEIDEAMKQYQTALKLNPDRVDAHINLGVAFLKKGWIDKAIEQYQIALILDPNNVDAHNNLGAAFGDKRWLDEAIEQFQIVLKLNPDHDNARKNLGRVYELRKTDDEPLHHKK